MRVALRAVVAGSLAMSLAGCLSVQGQVPVAVPLSTPVPPPRVVLPPAPEPIAIETPGPVATPSTQANTAGGRGAPPPVRPPVTAPPPVVPPPTPPEPPPVLQTTGNISEVEKRIQQQMDNAKRDLGRVVRSALAPDAQAQYDWALQLYKQAEDALKIRNYNYADQLSDKAARVASLLARGRLTSPTSA